jgi:ribonuclease P protein component
VSEAGPAAVPAVPGRLTRRAEFLAVANGARANLRGFALQAARRADETGPPRFGYTVTRKVGGAVERNRIRRRLKAAVRHDAALAAKAGYDYVLVGRREALDLPFDALRADLLAAFARAHAGGRRGKVAAPHGTGP